MSGKKLRLKYKNGYELQISVIRIVKNMIKEKKVQYNSKSLIYTIKHDTDLSGKYVVIRSRFKKKLEGKNNEDRFSSYYY